MLIAYFIPSAIADLITLNMAATVEALTKAVHWMGLTTLYKKSSNKIWDFANLHFYWFPGIKCYYLIADILKIDVFTIFVANCLPII